MLGHPARAWDTLTALAFICQGLFDGGFGHRPDFAVSG